jgi:hypothetical protein
MVAAGTVARLLGIEVPNRADQSPRREVVGAN